LQTESKGVGKRISRNKKTQFREIALKDPSSLSNGGLGDALLGTCPWPYFKRAPAKNWRPFSWSLFFKNFRAFLREKHLCRTSQVPIGLNPLLLLYVVKKYDSRWELECFRKMSACCTNICGYIMWKNVQRRARPPCPSSDAHDRNVLYKPRPDLELLSAADPQLLRRFEQVQTLKQNKKIFETRWYLTHIVCTRLKKEGKFYAQIVKTAVTYCLPKIKDKKLS